MVVIQSSHCLLGNFHKSSTLLPACIKRIYPIRLVPTPQTENYEYFLYTLVYSNFDLFNFSIYSFSQTFFFHLVSKSEKKHIPRSKIGWNAPINMKTIIPCIKIFIQVEKKIFICLIIFDIFCSI